MNELKEKGEIQEIISTNPSRGLGLSMDHILRNVIKTKYCFNLQEDWEFERPIDVDRILWTMDNHTGINNVVLNKIKNTGSLNRINQPEYNFDGLRMCLYAQWSFMPGFWRMDRAMKNWRVRVDRPEGYFTNSFGDHETRTNNEFCRKNIGAYLLGHTGDFRYVRHLGNNWRMAAWRLANGKPSGCHDASRMDDPYRAKWLPPLEQRPIYGEKEYTKEEIDKMLAEEAGIE